MIFKDHRSSFPAFYLDNRALVDEETNHFDDVPEGAARIVAKVENDAVDILFLELYQLFCDIDIAAVAVVVLEIGVKFGEIDITDFAFFGRDDDAAGELLILDNFVADERNDFDGAVGYL